ncbi:AlpA family phage regulatory protein [Paraburkholderia sp. JPY432]|nr:AlpA family phage regulatory protein [Paraburkholderia youngii]
MLIDFGIKSRQHVQEQTNAAQSSSQAAPGETELIPRAPNAIMRRQEVERAIGLSRSTIYNRVKAGTFPAPVKLGAGAVGWRVADIEQFLMSPADYRVTPTVPK